MIIAPPAVPLGILSYRGVLGEGGISPNEPLEVAGFAYPAETLVATGGAGSYQWYVNGLAVSGETGPTYTVRLLDIGLPIYVRRGGVQSPSTTCWHPRDVAQVKACWIAGKNAYVSISPNVEASDGQTVRQWVDIVNGWRLDQSVGNNQPLRQVAEVAGNDAIQFDGTNDILDGLTSAKGVFRNVGYAYSIVGFNDTSATSLSQDRIVILASTGTNALAARLRLDTRVLGVTVTRAGARRLDADASTAPGQPPSAGWQVLTVENFYATSGTVRLRRNGSQIASGNLPGSLGPSSDTDSLAFSVGNFNGGATGIPAFISCLVLASGNTALGAYDQSLLERFVGLCSGITSIPFAV